MAEKKGNDTPNTPDVSESELREMKIDDLRQEAKDAGVSGTSGMKKDELVREVAKARADGGGGKSGRGGDGGGKSKDGGGGGKGGGGNDTPNTPDVSETELREMKVDELRQEAKDAGISGTSGMNKDELVREIAKARASGGKRDRGGDADTDTGDEDLGAGPEGGKVRKGPESSKSLKYSQEVTSTEDEPEREGRSLVTTHHEVIKRWAEERDGVPATVEGTEHGDHLGVLRIDFGAQNDKLRRVSWEEWFATFDERGLNFIYQEETSDGRQSNFFQLENPNREDA